GILQMALGLDDRERTFHESDVCGLVVSPELDLLDCSFGNLDSLVTVVADLELAEHVGKPHDAEANPSAFEGCLFLSAKGMVPLVPKQHVVEKTNGTTGGFLKGGKI